MDKDLEIKYLRDKCKQLESLVSDYEIAITAIHSVVDRAIKFKENLMNKSDEEHVLKMR